MRRQTTARRRIPCRSERVFKIVGSPTPAARRSAWNASTTSGVIRRSSVTVKTDGDALEAEPGEQFERLRADSSAAECGDVVGSARAQLVDVEQAFHEHEFAPCRRRLFDDLRKPVGRETRSTCSAKVEVA